MFPNPCSAHKDFTFQLEDIYIKFTTLHRLHTKLPKPHLSILAQNYSFNIRILFSDTKSMQGSP